MIVAITGTPGTGKTSISNILVKNDFDVIDLNKIALENKFFISKDKKRDSWIVDIEKISDFINYKYSKNQMVIIEGHLSHLLHNIDIVIILRCHPEKLRKNLLKKNWKEEKINENVEAEILDIILCESIDLHSKDKIMEIDITNKTIEDVSFIIIENILNKFKNMKNYKVGRIDWSEENIK